MTRKEIIDGLKFTKGMFLFDPTTGNILTKEQLNEDDKTTVEACEGAIELLEQEPCEDAISRKALIEKMGYYPDLGKKQRRGIIESMPSVKPIRPKGKWENTDNDYPNDWHCSCCGAIVEVDERDNHNWNYCYHCGADMTVNLFPLMYDEGIEITKRELSRIY